MENKKKEEDRENNDIWKQRKKKDLTKIKDDFDETVVILIKDENNKRIHLNNSIERFSKHKSLSNNELNYINEDNHTYNLILNEIDKKCNNFEERFNNLHKTN
eukprot:434808_1